MDVGGMHRWVTGAYGPYQLCRPYRAHFVGWASIRGFTPPPMLCHPYGVYACGPAYPSGMSWSACVNIFHYFTASYPFNPFNPWSNVNSCSICVQFVVIRVRKSKYKSARKSVIKHRAENAEIAEDDSFYSLVLRETLPLTPPAWGGAWGEGVLSPPRSWR